MQASQFAIEKGIAIPPGWNSFTKKPLKYPLNEMAVGDSFFIPIENKARTEHVRMDVFAEITKLKKDGIVVKVSTRSVEGGMRVWRVK